MNQVGNQVRNQVSMYVYSIRLKHTVESRETFDWMYYLSNTTNIPKPLFLEGGYCDLIIGLLTPLDQKKIDMLLPKGIQFFDNKYEKAIIDQNEYNNEHELDVDNMYEKDVKPTYSLKEFNYHLSNREIFPKTWN